MVLISRFKLIGSKQVALRCLIFVNMLIIYRNKIICVFKQSDMFSDTV